MINDPPAIASSTDNLSVDSLSADASSAEATIALLINSGSSGFPVTHPYVGVQK